MLARIFGKIFQPDESKHADIYVRKKMINSLNTLILIPVLLIGIPNHNCNEINIA